MAEAGRGWPRLWPRLEAALSLIWCWRGGLEGESVKYWPKPALGEAAFDIARSPLRACRRLELFAAVGPTGKAARTGCGGHTPLRCSSQQSTGEGG